MPMSYRYELVPPQAGEPRQVKIHEEEFYSTFDEARLHEEIANLKANQRAYVDQAYYSRILAMLEGALKLLKEQS